MIFILNEKQLQRATALLGLSILLTCVNTQSDVAGTIFGILPVICLGIFIARLVWVIRHRRLVAIRQVREGKRKTQLRERFYNMLWIVWFVALFVLSSPITWKFWVVCAIAALLILGHLVPLEKK